MITFAKFFLIFISSSFVLTDCHFFYRNRFLLEMKIVKLNQCNAGVNIGVNSDSFKFLNFEKVYHNLGLYFELTEILCFESLYFYLDFKNSLKEQKIIGIESGWSFRIWLYPLNIGAFVIYSFLSPKLSVGITLSFCSSILSKLDVRIDAGSARIMSSNTQNLFDKKDFYNCFLNSNYVNLKLGKRLYKVISLNRENCKTNEIYFSTYMKAAELENFLKNDIKNLEDNLEQSNLFQFNINLEIFNKNLQKLNEYLQDMFLCITKFWLGVEYLSEYQIGIYRDYWNELTLNFNEQNMIYEKNKKNLTKLNEIFGFDIKKYLYLSILKTIMNPALLIEISSEYLEGDELNKRNQVLNLIND